MRKKLIFSIILTSLLFMCSCEDFITSVSITCHSYNDSNGFDWQFDDTQLFKTTGIDFNITDSYTWNIDDNNYVGGIFSLPNDFIIVYYRNKGHSPYNYEMKIHIKDDLMLINNDTKTVSKVYECAANERIIYGCKDYVIIYDSEQSQYNYIKLADNTQICSQKANLKKKKKYFAYLKSDCVIIEDGTKVIDTIDFLD